MTTTTASVEAKTRSVRVESAHVVELGAATRRDVAGGKAAALARAIAAGHRVPAGLVVTALAASHGTEALRAELGPRLDALGPGPYAVRSSAVHEDSATRSFAGQLETELDVPRAEVLAAIERCWASASALRVLRYGGSAGAVAVIVQVMVPAECAGVAFSADPRTGERGVCVIEAVTGLGERLVSGEADPETWRVEVAEAKRTRGNDRPVLDETLARRVADLARAMERSFGAPQDVEWAFANGELHLLQSRPITALPAAPVPIAITPPPGDWQRDDHHGVLSPLGWAWFAPYPRAMAEQMRTIGVPVETIRVERIGGNLYLQMAMPGGGGGAPPPAWVLWLVSRLLPSMRRATRTAEALLDREEYWSIVEQWESEVRPAMRAGIDALFVEDPSGLDDRALLARIEATLALSAEGLAHHARLGGPPTLGLGKLVLFVEDELGWAPERAVSLVTGSSTHTTELARSLERIVEAHEAELGGGELPRTWASLAARTPRLAAALAEWLSENRLRVLHYDPRHATLGEVPDLVLSIAESIVHARRAPRSETSDERATLLSEAKERLAPERYAELERLIERARRAYALRDENGVETVSRPAGLLRHFVVELGRRLGDHLEDPTHAVYLEPAEHADALAGRLPDLRERVTRRRGEESWALRNRGPLRYGKAPPPMPSPSAFPAPLARMFRIFGWMMLSETPREAPAEGGELVGVGVGTRVATARARVVLRPEELTSLRHGEVLVCRITSPEWSVALGRAGAIVTEEGGVLSHPAIIAREHGVPAVVGAAGAMRSLVTGDLVRVDPVAGRVAVVRAARHGAD